EGLVGAVCQTFLGLTVNCSRCHDHKFDPVTQKEYYQISAALGGTFQGDERESLSDAGRQGADNRIAALQSEIDDLTKLGQDADASRKRELEARRSRLESVLQVVKGGPARVTAPKQPPPWRILARGDFRQPGAEVAPRGIASVAGVSPDWGLTEKASEA